MIIKKDKYLPEVYLNLKAIILGIVIQTIPENLQSM